MLSAPDSKERTLDRGGPSRGRVKSRELVVLDVHLSYCVEVDGGKGWRRCPRRQSLRPGKTLVSRERGGAEEERRVARPVYILAS